MYSLVSTMALLHFTGHGVLHRACQKMLRPPLLGSPVSIMTAEKQLRRVRIRATTLDSVQAKNPAQKWLMRACKTWATCPRSKIKEHGVASICCCAAYARVELQDIRGRSRGEQAVDQGCGE